MTPLCFRRLDGVIEGVGPEHKWGVCASWRGVTAETAEPIAAWGSGLYFLFGKTSQSPGGSRASQPPHATRNTCPPDRSSHSLLLLYSHCRKKSPIPSSPHQLAPAGPSRRPHRRCPHHRTAPPCSTRAALPCPFCFRQCISVLPPPHSSRAPVAARPNLSPDVAPWSTAAQLVFPFLHKLR